ncbi:MAG: type VI secretion system ImpA domain-containing protein [Desulfobulbaceae bacterium A2]|nr:MAG: type VI secretion system ImpA domain-containing protein [Desulfobulbaceae bacterium A2]
MDVLTLGLFPVSEENPAGEDIRYHPDFESLQAEVDKISLPSAAGGAIDWAKISSMSAAILAKQSKDLLVAAYFAVAQLHLAGLPGLEAGLGVLTDLVTTFWETLFPQLRRMRGRVAALEWWIEKSESALGSVRHTVVDETVKARLLERCARIQDILAGYIPENCPDLAPVVRILEALASTAAPPQSPAAAAVAAAPDPSPPLKVQAAAPVTPAVTAPPSTEVAVSVDSLLVSLRDHTLDLLEGEVSSTQPHRLLRLAVWAAIDAAPPVTDDDLTLVPAPEQHLSGMLRELESRGDWRGLVSAAENQLPQHIFWLDLNRFAASALRELGPACQGAADSVALETACFVARHPELPTRKFADGTPFADGETRAWLEGIALTRGGGSGPGSSAASHSEGGGLPGRLQTMLQSAQALVREKTLAGAAADLGQEIRRASSRRERMLWQLTLFRIALHSKTTELLHSLVDQIMEDMEAYQLASWEPEFAMQILGIVRSGCLKCSDKALRERAATVQSRMARIDPVQTLLIEK